MEHRDAVDIHRRHEERLMRIPSVLGVGVVRRRLDGPLLLEVHVDGSDADVPEIVEGLETVVVRG